MCVVYSEKKSFRVSLLGKLLTKYVINKNVWWGHDLFRETSNNFIYGEAFDLVLKNEFDFKNRENRRCLLGKQISGRYSNTFNILIDMF